MDRPRGSSELEQLAAQDPIGWQRGLSMSQRLVFAWTLERKAYCLLNTGQLESAFVHFRQLQVLVAEKILKGTFGQVTLGKHERDRVREVR